WQSTEVVVERVVLLHHDDDVLDPAERATTGRRVGVVAGGVGAPRRGRHKQQRDREYERAMPHWSSSLASKSNMSKRSLTAGMLSGTYGLLAATSGFGRLSRLRPVSGARCQLRSMNFTTDAWS